MRPLSLVFPVSDSPECTPSVKAYGFATFPKGTALGGDGKLSGIAKRRPLGGAGTAQAVTERVLPQALTKGVTQKTPPQA